MSTIHDGMVRNLSRFQQRMASPSARLWLLAVLLLGISILKPAMAQETILSPGPPVGETIPTFQARDQFGRAQTLASLSGPQGLVLLFFRSADW